MSESKQPRSLLRRLFRPRLAELSVALLILGACAPSPKSVGVGTSKDDVLKALGKPAEWVTIQASVPGQLVPVVTVGTFYSVDALRTRQMPDGETWLFEYNGPDGKPFTLVLRYGSVAERQDGPAMRR